MRTRSFLALPLALSLGLLAHATLCVAAPGPAAAPVDELAEFEKARNAYRAKEYEEAEARFEKLLDPATGVLRDKLKKKEARMYWAATMLALGKDGDAAGQFEIILEEDPQYEPDSVAFATEIVNKFIDTRARIHERLEAAEAEKFRRLKESRANAEAARQREAERIKMLERLAREVEVTDRHSRWIALLPFGIGQFQNGQRRAGWFFLVSESLFVGTGVATVPFYYVDLANAHDVFATSSVNAQEYLDRANAVRIVNLSAYGALALTVIVGAIVAEATYVPDVVTIKPRAVPAIVPTTPTPPAVSPVSFGASPVPGRDARGIGGGTVNLSVAF